MRPKKRQRWLRLGKMLSPGTRPVKVPRLLPHQRPSRHRLVQEKRQRVSWSVIYWETSTFRRPFFHRCMAIHLRSHLSFVLRGAYCYLPSIESVASFSRPTMWKHFCAACATIGFGGNGYGYRQPNLLRLHRIGRKTGKRHPLEEGKRSEGKVCRLERGRRRRRVFILMRRRIRADFFRVSLAPAGLQRKNGGGGGGGGKGGVWHWLT